MSGTALWRAGLGGGWGRGGLGELPWGLMPCVCLLIISVWETTTSEKQAKEVHILLVTPEKTCVSLLGNVRLSSVLRLF